MKIAFLAKHGCGDNQDEDAISHALRQLGHEVTCLPENSRHRNVDPGLLNKLEGHDLLLFLKWPDTTSLARAAAVLPCAYWHFDMIEPVDGDPTLSARSRHRLNWCGEVYPYVIAGFHTDGDYVNKVGGKLIHLPQGFDERQAAAPGTAPRQPGAAPVLFTGMINHGQRRAGHIQHLQSRWGRQFAVVGDGGGRYRYHGQALAGLLQSARVVVAPSGPGTDSYWSNRVVLTCGLGGLLLHPRSSGLFFYYWPGEHLHYYLSEAHLDQLIEYYLDSPAKAEEMALAGHHRTLQANLYRHRCEQLIDAVKERTNG